MKRNLERAVINYFIMLKHTHSMLPAGIQIFQQTHLLKLIQFITQKYSQIDIEVVEGIISCGREPEVLVKGNRIYYTHCWSFHGPGMALRHTVLS